MRVTGKVRFFEEGSLGPITMHEITFETRDDHVVMHVSRTTRETGNARAQRAVRLPDAHAWIEHLLELVEARAASLPVKRPPVALPDPPPKPPGTFSRGLTFQVLLREPEELTHQFDISNAHGQAIREVVRQTVDDIIAGDRSDVTKSS